MADTVFNVEKARKAGVSDDDILTHLAETRKYDVSGATKALTDSGTSLEDAKRQIIEHLAGTPRPFVDPPKGPPGDQPRSTAGKVLDMSILAAKGAANVYGEGAKKLVTGAAKGLASTAIGFGDLMDSIPVIGPLHKAVVGPVPPEAREWAKPKKGEGVGFAAEQMAEFMLGGEFETPKTIALANALKSGLTGKAAIAAAEKAVAGMGKRELIEETAKRGLKEGARAAAVGSVQGGDIRKGLETGAIASTAPAAGAIASKLAPHIKEGALKVMANFLLPGSTPQHRLKNKMTVAETGKEVIERGITAWSSKGFRDRAAAETEALGKKIGEVYKDAETNPAFRPSATKGGAPVHGGFIETQPLIDDLKKISLEEFHPAPRVPAQHSGKVTGRATPAPPNSEPVQLQYNKHLADIISRTDADGHMPISELHWLRQKLDDMVTDIGHLAPDAETSAAGKAALATADVARHHLNSWVPSLSAVNPEYSFWRGLRDVTQDVYLKEIGKEQGVQKGAKSVAKSVAKTMATAVGAGGAAGYATHNPYVAAMAFSAMALAQKFVESAALKTRLAVYGDRIGSALQSRQFEEAIRLMGLAMRPEADKKVSDPPKPKGKNVSMASPPPPQGVDFVYDPGKQSFSRVS